MFAQFQMDMKDCSNFTSAEISHLRMSSYVITVATSIQSICSSRACTHGHGRIIWIYSAVNFDYDCALQSSLGFS
jgi:hypothetical protein